jgi:hypothetical protein
VVNKKMKTIFTAAVFIFATSAFAGSSHLPLRYDRALASQGFVSPVLVVKVNGKEGAFLMDSGASMTVISRWYGDLAKIRTEGYTSASGSSGSSSASTLAKLDFSITARNGNPVLFQGQNALVVDLPSFFQENRIAGIVSPQQLLRDNEYGILDLSESPSFEITENKPQSLKHASQLEQVVSDGPGGQKTVLFTLMGEVEGVRTSFIVDTGADAASIGIKTEAGRKLFPKSVPSHEKTGGIAGKPVEIRVAPHARTKILGVKSEMEIRLQPISEKMPADGMLGMRFLKNCSLILSQKFGSISCP